MHSCRIAERQLNAISKHFIVTIAAMLGLSVGIATVSAADKTVNYARDIKPILTNRCYACHGPDAKQRKADLRLDVREVALEAIVPGKSDESELIHRLTTDDPEVRMPPPKSKKPGLTEAEVDLLRRWVNEGAKFDLHWSYVRPTRPAVPKRQDAAWPINEIDEFIADSHEVHGFAPSADADRRTLIRRLSFDLIGLPPSAGQIDAFTTSNSKESYEELVDKLLASKQFGERMAMYWLDLVRYADTNGIHGDNHRDHDLFRDYVIDAFNNNKPFDKFTLEQLAGDLLPNPTREQRVASGYNRLNMTTREGGAQAKEYLAKYAADRVRNASVVWLGSTMGCAECHDHKFDPFSTKDFYSFAAFFADIQETAVGTQKPERMPTDEQAQQVKQIDEQIAKLHKTLETPTPELAAGQFKWEQKLRAELANKRSDWQVVKPEKTESSGGATLTLQDDQSVLSSGTNPPKDTYTVTLTTDVEQITGIRLEALTHESFANQSLSRANGNFVLTRFEVEAASLGAADAMPVKIKSAVADYSQKDYPIANAIDGKPKTGWAVDGQGKKEGRVAAFVFDKHIVGGPATTITVRMRHESQFAQHNIGRFRLALTSADKPSLDGRGGLPVNVFDALVAENEKRTEAQKTLLATHFRGIAPELASQRKQLAELENQKKAVIGAFRPILVSMSTQPRAMRVLRRGNWLDDSGEVVQPAIPAFLGAIDVKQRRANRLDLARWFVQPDNPLVARVYVNRLWKLVFGRGLVRSLDDYGSQGMLPSHPELLDWLAVEFVESGWDTKHMLKLMVMSRTYRQSSLETKELRQRDPPNRWLARQNRFRLDAEMVRDNALSISGLLVRKVGGPSVKPYQPTGYWSHLNFPKREWKHDSGESQYRRGMYTYWCRTFLHPSLLAFDAPSREETCVERPRSNTPIQALVLLNDPTYVEAARIFAARIMREGGDNQQGRLEFAYRQALGRKPKPSEIMILTALFENHLKQYTDDKAAAGEVLKAGETKTPEDLDATQLAAWTSVARVILNLHETITRS